MGNIFIDLGEFFKSLTLYDILFLLSLLVLFIMLVSLVYVFKINKDELDDSNDDDKNNDVNKKKNNIKKSNVNKKDNVNEDLNLLELTKELEEKKSTNISLNDYEREQEEKAIISYDELLAATGSIDIPISYKKEENVDGLLIKAVDLDLFKTSPLELPKMKEEMKESKPLENVESVKVESNDLKLISYEKEEAFLETLKNLRGLLN